MSKQAENTIASNITHKDNSIAESPDLGDGITFIKQSDFDNVERPSVPSLITQPVT